MANMNIDEFIKLLPKLIKEDDRIKGAIISALSGVVATHEDIIAQTEAMDKRFEAMQKQMDTRFEAMQKQMDTRFEAIDKRFDAMQKQMDTRFEAMQKQMDKRFDAMQKQMDTRFDAMQKQMDKRFDAMDHKIDRNYDDLKSILYNIQNSIGKPFEQFARNVIIRLLASEGITKVKLENITLPDPENFMEKGNYEIEIDGFSLDPPIIVEITSVLRTKNKIDKFLKKKEFVENLHNKKFRGFFVAASTEFDVEELGEITITLRKHQSELINL